LALRKRVDGAPERVLLEADVERLLRPYLVAGDQVAVGRAPLRGAGLVEARDRTGVLSHLTHLLQRQLRRLRDLLLGRRPGELGHELSLRPRDLALAVDDVERDADVPRQI